MGRWATAERRRPVAWAPWRVAWSAHARARWRTRDGARRSGYADPDRAFAAAVPMGAYRRWLGFQAGGLVFVTRQTPRGWVIVSCWPARAWARRVARAEGGGR